MKLSLKNKLIILLLCFAVLLSAAAILVSSRVIRSMSDEDYTIRADELSATLARVVDPEAARELVDDVMEIYHDADEKVGSEDWGSPAFEAYLAPFASVEDSPAFQTLMAQLRSIQEVNSVECLYLVVLDPELANFIYLVDAALEDPCPPGVFDPIYEGNRAVLNDPRVGFPAYITNTNEYGWLVTAGAPVYDADGKVVCYAVVDISMDSIRDKETAFQVRLAAMLVLLTAVLSFIAMLYVTRSVVRPVNMLSAAASQYGSKPADGSSHSFQDIHIRTGDEIESLFNSMVKMKQDIDSYITNLIETQEQLSSTRLHAQRMNDLAMNDALTGIRNKLAYNQELRRLSQEMQEGQTEFGIAMFDLNGLKKTNDTYGHEYGDKAIIRISRIICDTFQHSPVFRIGGDEFVAVLRDRDYRDIDALSQQFQETLAEYQTEDIPLWERVSAAMGVARFNPEVDKSPEDVFRRADHIMYQNKMAAHQGRE